MAQKNNTVAQDSYDLANYLLAFENEAFLESLEFYNFALCYAEAGNEFGDGIILLFIHQSFS